MPYLELPDGVPLSYTDEGSGPAVVLIHGWTMNSTFWAENTPALVANGNRVIAVDLRGHGLSGKTPDGHSLTQYARDVNDLLTALHLENVSLVGWSLGANVALSFLNEFGSDRVRSLVLVDQSPRFLSADGWQFPLFGAHTNADVATFVQSFRHERPAAIKPFLASCYASEPDEATIDAAYAQTTQTPTDAALNVWMDMVHADFRWLLPKIDVPVLLLYGDNSKIFPGELADWLAGQLPDATAVRFANSGHMPFIEEAGLFNTELTTFLSRRR